MRFETPGFRASQAVTSANGTYRLRYIRDIWGAAVGEHSVMVYDNTNKRRVPPRYKTEPLRHTVETGSNEIPIELTSDG